VKTLSIDIETYSDVELGKCGVYKYAESPAFEILLFGYSVDNGEAGTIDLAQGETLPPDLIDALVSDEVVKWAYNANFERVCLSRYLRDKGLSLDPFHDGHPLSTERARFLNPESWRCSMVWASTMGLPRSLEGVGTVLGLEKQKLTEGKDLIRYFCVPCTPTKSNGGRTRNLPRHAPDKWEAFKRYNIRDVETEMGSSSDCPNSRCRTPCGTNTTSIRRSTTAASDLTWILWRKPSRWIPGHGRSSLPR
jgi:DNA polymerase bacteriophage-type